MNRSCGCCRSCSGSPSEGLTTLEQQRVATGTDGQWLGARHAVEVERAAADLAHRHQHAPVDAAELVGATRAALVVVLQEGIAVQHQHPRPAMKCQARIADASGSQAVPEPMRVIGIPNGRSGIMRADPGHRVRHSHRIRRRWRVVARMRFLLGEQRQHRQE